MNYDWDFSILLQHENLKVLLWGFAVTTMLTLYSLVFGTLLGIAVGTLASLGTNTGQSLDRSARSSRFPWLSRQALAVTRWIALIYIDVIRAIPLLLLILIAYYGIPVIVKVGAIQQFLSFFGRKTPLEFSAFQTSVIALSINLSAFLADLVRGGVAGVSQGSMFAGRSLGMSRWLVWRRIVLPDVLREILPSVTLLYITIFKMSTLCSIVAVYEVLHSADAITQRTYKPLEAYVAVCVMFIAVIVPLSLIARRMETTNLFRRRSA